MFVFFLHVCVLYKFYQNTCLDNIYSFIFFFPMTILRGKVLFIQEVSFIKETCEAIVWSVTRIFLFYKNKPSPQLFLFQYSHQACFSCNYQKHQQKRKKWPIDFYILWNAASMSVFVKHIDSFNCLNKFKKRNISLKKKNLLKSCLLS